MKAHQYNCLQLGRLHCRMDYDQTVLNYIINGKVFWFTMTPVKNLSICSLPPTIRVMQTCSDDSLQMYKMERKRICYARKHCNHTPTAYSECISSATTLRYTDFRCTRPKRTQCSWMSWCKSWTEAQRWEWYIHCWRAFNQIEDGCDMCVVIMATVYINVIIII